MSEVKREYINMLSADIAKRSLECQGTKARLKSHAQNARTSL